MTIEQLKHKVRQVSNRYKDREQRARRLFIEDRAVSLDGDRDREFDIKKDISSFLGIAYSSVSFCGSAQLGFSSYQDTLFVPAVSDLDAACIDIDLFQQAWVDIVATTRAFSDLTPFGMRGAESIERFQNAILRRGMIKIDAMPQSDLSRSWNRFEGEISRRHTAIFKRISLAIYMNEYAFCWKQDSAISALRKVG